MNVIEGMISPEMKAMLEAHYGARLTEGHLRMALVPEGAVLEKTEEIRWPTIRIQNTWVMPGIPEVFRMKIPVIVARVGRAGSAFVSRAVVMTFCAAVMRSVEPKVFKADHPFLFFIRDRKTDTVLFSGRLLVPR